MFMTCHNNVTTVSLMYHYCHNNVTACTCREKYYFFIFITIVTTMSAAMSLVLYRYCHNNVTARILREKYYFFIFITIVTTMFAAMSLLYHCCEWDFHLINLKWQDVFVMLIGKPCKMLFSYFAFILQERKWNWL